MNHNKENNENQHYKKQYNKNNIFYKIINNEIKSEKLFENDSMIIIKDINPAADIHLLAIPKKNVCDYSDFLNLSTESEVKDFFDHIDDFMKKQNQPEYRLVTNNGALAGQEIFHFHMHILVNFDKKLNSL